MSRARVTINKKIETKALLNYDISQCRVAVTLGISTKMCQTKLKNNLCLSNIPGQCRKRALTAVEDRNLL